MKVITYCLAPPNDIVAALLDENNRKKWDTGLLDIVKVSSDTVKITYENQDAPWVESI